MSAYFVPTRFTWQFGGQVVHLCGSFTRWVETVPMACDDTSPGVFAVVVHLPPGYHQYKFIVDGEWRHDETQPFMPDPLGNVNNWLFVRRPEQTQTQGIMGSSSAQLTQPQQHPQQQLQHQPSSPVLQHPSQAPPSPQHPLQHAPSHLHQQQHQQPSLIATASSVSNQSDVDMQNADSLSDTGMTAAPTQADEPGYTRKRFKDFLTTHTVYELIPESGKVVLLDVELPVRQAFHALHEQGVAAASLWDAQAARVAGIISASDFIYILRRLRNSVSSGANPMSEEEMDQHTIRGLREDAGNDGRPARGLIYVKPEDRLDLLVERLFANEVSLAPCVSTDPDGPEVCTLLHIATFGSILAYLLRHFRVSLASLPLLAQPVGALPIGTWSQTSVQAHLDNHSDNGAILDLYARTDITTLCRGNSYNRLQWEDVTVSQALALTVAPPSSTAELSQRQTSGSPMRGIQHSPAITQDPAPNQRLHWCTATDSLRLVVERLATPGVRRVFVIHPESHQVEGVIALSDVAAFLFQ